MNYTYYSKRSLSCLNSKCDTIYGEMDPLNPWNKKINKKKNINSTKSNQRAHWHSVDLVMTRAGESTTQVLVLPKMINMNMLKTLYSSTTWALIFQYSYSYVQYLLISRDTENALCCIPADLDGKPTLDQARHGCCQATSHYLSQSWPSPMMPYAISNLEPIYDDIWCH